MNTGARSFNVDRTTFAVERDAHGMEVFLARPKGAGAWPTVLLLMDMWGFRRTIVDIASEVASRGYCVAAPDVYWRSGRIRLDEEPGCAAVRSFTQMPPATLAKLRAAMDALDDDDVVDDVVALVAKLDALTPGRHPIGTFGYCMGGRHVLCIAGAMPERVRATACLHGTGLIRDDERSPHRRALAAQGEIYCGHAGNDRYAPADTPQRLAEALVHGRASYSAEVHAGAQHGYALHDRDIYDPNATAQDWNAIHAMFARRLAAA